MVFTPSYDQVTYIHCSPIKFSCDIFDNCLLELHRGGGGGVECELNSFKTCATS